MGKSTINGYKYAWYMIMLYQLQYAWNCPGSPPSLGDLFGALGRSGVDSSGSLSKFKYEYLVNDGLCSKCGLNIL
jgi:hypothetical protein